MEAAYRLRPATPGDGMRLQQVEVAAGAAYASVGMTEIAEDEPLSIAGLAAYATAGRSWVVTDAHDEVVGYVIVDPVDGCAHIEQISVHPEHQGRGLGQMLLDEVDRWAGRQGWAALTLTTFTSVPWNGPLYRHLGFVALAEHDLGPGLAALRKEEAMHGLDPALRICMRRDVRSAP